MPNVIANSRPSNQDIAGLVSEYRWSTSSFLYFSFPSHANQFTGYPDNSEPDIGFEQLNGTQQGIVVSILDYVEDLTMLVFWSAATFNKPPEEAELRFGMTDDTEVAHAYTPYDDELAGDVWFNNSSGEFDAPVRGSYAYMGFLHEIGHALGLKHPHETDIFGAMTAPHDNMNYTVISYRSYAGMDADAGYANEEFGYAQTFMMYDIAALQYLYGADFGMNSDDSVYKWDPLSGKMTINGVDKHNPGANKIFMTIWDGGGVDTYDLSGYATSVTIDLNPGLWSKTSAAQLAYLGDGHFADGNIANALQYMNDSRSLIENAIGGAGNDRLVGNKIANTLTGGAGNDTLEGGLGADTLIGGEGFDILSGGSGDDRLEGGDGFDQLQGGTGSDDLFGGAGDDVMFDDDESGGAGNDRMFGDDGWDSLHINRRGLSAPTQVLLDGGGGPDDLNFSGQTFQDDATLLGGDGDDIINAFRGHIVTIDAGAGDDRVALYFLGAVTTVTLGSGKDFLALHAYLGGAPAGGSVTVTDFETGAAGDRLELLGYLVDRLDNWDPAANPFASHLRLVQEGTDTLLQLDSDGPGAPAPFETLLRLQNVQTGELGVYNLGGYAGDGSAPVPATIVGTPGLDQLWGTGGNDLIQGLGSQDEIFGGGGNDRIEGGDGDDLLYGQYGDDQLFGDAGIDNLVDQEGGDDRFFGGAETDYLVILRKDATPLSDVLLDGGEGDDRLDFNALHRTDGATLVGGNGDDDIIIAGNGQITVDAGAGADHVGINFANAHVVLTLGAGLDVVDVSADFGFGAGLTLVFNDFAPGSSAGSDVLVLHNYLTSRLQNWDGTTDPFEAGYLRLVQSGSDTLLTVDFDGSAGAGGFSTLVTFLNVSADSLTAFNLGGLNPLGLELLGTEGADVLNGDAGDNRIDGLGGNDIINGGAGADTISGGAGEDSLNGEGGDDTYYVDTASDLVFESTNEGRDVVYSTSSWALSAGSHVEVISTASTGGTEAIDLTGNALVQEIDGNAGNNFLNGGGGADVLVGFGGDDQYFITSGTEIIVEHAGQGRDVAYTIASHILDSNIHLEVLSTTSIASTAAINLTGNAFVQEIIGNNGNNFLNGGGGADTLVGYGGDDQYFITTGTETIVEHAGQGRDVAYTIASHVLDSNIHLEVLSTTSIAGTAAINLTGNAFVQEIVGNNGSNILNGGGGADVLVGYGGDDTYYVIHGGERVLEAADGGRDVVYTAFNFTLEAGSHVEVLSTSSFGSTAAIDLFGNEFGQELYGNAGGNILNGAGGADYLIGGGGADYFDFTTALGGGNIDTIVDMAAGSDKIRLDDAVFAGLTGGALNANAFVIGSQAADADDRIVYNSATGQLFYDADGSGAGAQVLFATLAANPPITAADFMVI